MITIAKPTNIKAREWRLVAGVRGTMSLFEGKIESKVKPQAAVYIYDLGAG